MCVNVLFTDPSSYELLNHSFEIRAAVLCWLFVSSERRNIGVSHALVHPEVPLWGEISRVHECWNKSTISRQRRIDHEISSSRSFLTMTNFPAKLLYLLDEMERDGQSDIMSWQPNGQSFVVHNKTRLEETILPQWVARLALNSIDLCFFRVLRSHARLSLQINQAGFGKQSIPRFKGVYFARMFDHCHTIIEFRSQCFVHSSLYRQLNIYGFQRISEGGYFKREWTPILSIFLSSSQCIVHSKHRSQQGRLPARILSTRSTRVVCQHSTLPK